MREVIINADDLGLAASVDAAIVDLASRGIVTAASLMSLYAPAQADLAELARQRISLGLHLDLTSAAACSRYACARPLRRLIAASWCRRLDRCELKAAVREQLDRFCQRVGAAPAFVDGHEHVHQFPMIRDALLEALAELAPTPRPYLRYTQTRVWRGGKAASIAALGAGTLRRMGSAAGYAGNADFAGVYALDREVPLDQCWNAWLAQLPRHGGLLMCHPGTDAAQGAFRLREYRYLTSAAFRDTLMRHAVRPVAWS